MRKSVTLLLMAAAITVFTGCEDDSSSKKDTVLETGNSTIRGNITDTGDISARSVSAKVAATIPVWLKGTTTETYTDQNGNFIFENIPAGDYTICFEIGGKTYEYPVSVSEGATLIISNLGVSADGTVVVSSVRESAPSNNNSSNPDTSPDSIPTPTPIPRPDPDPVVVDHEEWRLQWKYTTIETMANGDPIEIRSESSSVMRIDYYDSGDVTGYFGIGGGAYSVSGTYDANVMTFSLVHRSGSSLFSGSVGEMIKDGTTATGTHSSPSNRYYDGSFYSR